MTLPGCTATILQGQRFHIFQSNHHNAIYCSLSVQIKLLKILSYLGAGDTASSDNMYAVLGDTLRKANSGHTIANAIVAECVRTITAIYPNPGLLQAGAHAYN